MTKRRSRGLIGANMSRLTVVVASVLLALVVALSFAIDWRNVAQGGMVDLRNRIVGIRVLESGIDPYHYKWHAGQPLEYCDPGDKPNRTVSRTTVTPALLLLHLPLAMLPYRLGEFVWLACQWALLLGTGALWLGSSTNARTRWLVALVVVGFSFTCEWRLHAERGQCYVLLLFLFACWLATTRDPRRGTGFWAGTLAGFLGALRPPFIMLLPFLALHRRGQLPGAVTGLALGFALPMVMRLSCWGDYFSATQTFSYLYRNNLHASPIPPVLPPEIEGMPLGLIRNALYLPGGIFSIHNFLLQHGLEPFPAWPPLLAFGLAFLAWVWLTRRHGAERLLPGLVAWVFLADLCLPVYRESYDDVIVLNVIAAGLVVAPKIPVSAWPAFAAIAVGAVVYWRNLDHPWVILPPALYTVAAALAVLTVFWTASGTPGTRPKAAASG